MKANPSDDPLRIDSRQAIPLLPPNPPRSRRPAYPPVVFPPVVYPRSFAAGRLRAPEYLDQGWLPAAPRQASLADLEWVNRYTGGLRAMRSLAVEALTRRQAIEGGAREGGAGNAGGAIDIVDLGSGSGAPLREISATLAKSGQPVAPFLVDREAAHLDLARRHWRLDAGGRTGCAPPRFIACDALSYTPRRRHAMALTSLLLHHLDDDALAPFFAGMRSVARHWIIHEVERSRFAFWMIRALLPFVVRTRVTVADGMISVQQGFKLHELIDLATAAGWKILVARRYKLARLGLLLESP